MSLDSTQVATIGSIAAPVATLFGPVGAIAGLAIAGGTAYASSELAAQEQEDLASRNQQVLRQQQGIQERAQRRHDQAVQARVRGRIATSGFTTRGTPIEVLANTVADQEERVLQQQYRNQLTADDLKYRSDFGARQTRAQGVAGLASGLASAGQTVLTRIHGPSLMETT